MIEDADAEQIAHGTQPLCERQVLRGRLGAARGVLVDEDGGSGVREDERLGRFPWVNQAALREPTLTRLTPITRFFPSSITTQKVSRSRSTSSGAISLATSPGSRTVLSQVVGMLPSRTRATRNLETRNR